MIEKCDILAFSPHPDDVELACSGSILLSTQKELCTVIIDITEGEKSSIGTRL